MKVLRGIKAFLLLAWEGFRTAEFWFTAWFITFVILVFWIGQS